VIEGVVGTRIELEARQPSRCVDTMFGLGKILPVDSREGG